MALGAGMLDAGSILGRSAYHHLLRSGPSASASALYILWGTHGPRRATSQKRTTLDVMTHTDTTRPLTDDELRLACWMLENGGPDARAYLSQLEAAEATTWYCTCGCASFNFKVSGRPEAPPGVHILGDFLFGSEADLFGVFIFESNGTLSGVEVYGLAGDAPATLPAPESLRPWGGSPPAAHGARSDAQQPIAADGPLRAPPQKRRPLRG